VNGLIPPPDPLGIPAPYPIFQVLYWITFVLHLIFMNYVLGGMVMVTLHEWFTPRNATAIRANALMLKLMPVSLSLAITMGVAPLLFVQVLLGNFFYTANIMMSGWWLGMIGLVIAAFYLIYILIARRRSENQSSALHKIGSLVVTLLLLATAWIFTNNAVLVEHPKYWQDIHTGAKWILAPDPSLWPRYLHNLFGAAAVAGLVCAVIGRYRLRYHADDAELGTHLIRRGIFWAMHAVVIQIITGIIYIYSWEIEITRAFMGNGILFTGWAIGFFAVMGALVCLILALVKTDKPMLIWGAVGLTFVTLLGMTMGRELLRLVSLAPYIKLQDLPLRPSYSSLLLFLITFLLGLGILAYLLRLVWTLPREESESKQA